MLPKIRVTEWQIRLAGENGYSLWCKQPDGMFFSRVGDTYATIDAAKERMLRLRRSRDLLNHGVIQT